MRGEAVWNEVVDVGKGGERFRSATARNLYIIFKHDNETIKGNQGSEGSDINKCYPHPYL